MALLRLPPYAFVRRPTIILRCPVCGCTVIPGICFDGCPDCGLDGDEFAYYDEADFIPEKELNFD